MTTVLRAQGLLREFADAGVLSVADVQVARRLGTLARESAEPVLLAVALAVRAVRLGAVCVELRRLREVSVEDVDVAALPWPAHDDVIAALRRSPLVVGGLTGPLRPLRLVDSDGGELLYLDRYFRQEQTIRDALDDRARTTPAYDAELLSAGLAARFGPAPDRQRVAAALAVTRWTSIVAGGPGTGKTYTVARILQLLQEQTPGLRIALAAPTGKAAARLQEQVNDQGVDVPAVTLHRLLGWRPDSATRFRHDAGNRLPHDIVVVDETSMVSLTMMARLLEAVRPDARLVLVGDPDQLASVDAGAVLGDLVARPVRTLPSTALGRLLAADLAAADDPDETALSPAEVQRLDNGVVRLSRGRRFAGAIADLAVAVRAGDEDAVMQVLWRGDPAVTLVAPDDLAGLRRDVADCSRIVTAAALSGDIDTALRGLEQHRLL
ncbi:MAG: AAA family ATPase, partial [Frankiales bacterium]|nr:AAA family ATPase [Frankiales bacterium]